jgi:hypothetical protein
MTFLPNSQAGDAPFNKTAPWPITITATVHALPSWGIAHNAATAPPSGPVCSAAPCGSAQQVQLVPYGRTSLRIGELPMA